MNKLTADRKFWPTLLLTIVTLGFYQWYLIYTFAKETNIACKEDGKKTPGLTIYVLLSIITLGIYAIVWRCMWIKRCNSYLRQNGKSEGLQISTYLLVLCGWLFFNLIHDISFYQSDTLEIISLCGLLIFSLMFIVILCKQLYLQNAVNSTYNEIKAHSKKEWLNGYLRNTVKNAQNDSTDEPYDNLAETQCTKKPASINNKIPPSVKRYRTIATIFTTLAVIVSIGYELIWRYWNNIGVTFDTLLTIDSVLRIANILFPIIILFSLLKISANKATRNAVIIIFATIIFNHLLSYLLNIFPHKISYWFFSYLPILYYLCISYAVSIILRNNRFAEDAIKKTWFALLPLLWICPGGRVFLWYFPIILIPACFYAIHSSAFCGPSEEETLTTKPYTAINRYTIASLIICILVYLANTYFIIEYYRETAHYYM